MGEIEIIDQTELPPSSFAREFVGADHQGVALTFLWVEAEPGDRVKLHKHPYDEIFFILEGRAEITDGSATREVTGGQVVVIPAERPHGFRNSGDGVLRQIDVHASATFSTDWLE